MLLMVHERTSVYVCLNDREVRTTKLVLKIVFPYEDILSSAIYMHKYMIFWIICRKIRMNGIQRPHGKVESMINLYRRKLLRLVLKVRFNIVESMIPFWYYGVNVIFLVSLTQWHEMHVTLNIEYYCLCLSTNVWKILIYLGET